MTSNWQKRIHQSHHAHSRDKQRLECKGHEQGKVDTLWKDACNRAAKTGKLHVSWLELEGNVPWESVQRCNIGQLTLDGIGLTSIERICHLKQLTHLSLVSNDITSVQGVGRLNALAKLHLQRNMLTTLPPEIGQLASLTRLDVANNCISLIPKEIKGLLQLRHLNLECNELHELPVEFKFLAIEELVLNCNQFRLFPEPVLDLKRLKRLSINDNLIVSLPSGMGNFRCLEELKAARNRIVILPDSFVDIENLKVLWLDNNQLSSLPLNFHRLLNLTTLKMDGNVDLIYPSLETVLEGIDSVLTWSSNRLAMKNTQKVRDIAQAIVEVLKQTSEYKLGGDLQHDSLLEIVDGGQYQFAPEALWQIFLPELKKIWCDPINKKSAQKGIKSFPYERSEVENALFQYKDAAGPIVRQIKNARFRNCSCVQTGRAEAPCTLHEKEWKCSRPALVLRPNCVYEDNMVERRRQEKYKNQLNQAQRLARENAKAFLSSNDGKIFVREEAEERLNAGVCTNSGKRQELSQGSSLVSIPTQIRHHISYRLHKIKAELGGKHRAQLEHTEKQVRDEYIRCEVLKRTNEVKERQEKVKVVLTKWMGLTISDFFSGWLSVLNESRQNLLRIDRQVLRDQQLQHQDDLAKYELALISVSHPPTTWQFVLIYDSHTSLLATAFKMG